MQKGQSDFGFSEIDLNKLIYYEKKNEYREYFRYRINQIYSIFFHRSYYPKYRRYAGKAVMSFEKCNETIARAIESKEPYWAGRYGMNEMNMIVETIRYLNQLPNQRKEALEKLCGGAGFFPNNLDDGEKFTKKMLECCKELDLHAVWPINMEDWIIQCFEKEDVQLTRLGYLEPWNLYRYKKEGSNQNMWTAALKGKKVLVIHPFTETIVRQYKEKRQEIFSKVVMDADSVLPQFDLIPLKAIQTCAGQRDERFDSWFEALSYMEEECQKIDFDVAIIGCGAYGFPLACNIKRRGKVAIHMGGATQLMFGILGRRWDTAEFRENVVNASWTRPSRKEQPIEFLKVEGGCYW